jgi:hypothetical protein
MTKTENLLHYVWIEPAERRTEETERSKEYLIISPIAFTDERGEREQLP